jgi:thioredoxin 1
MKQITSNEFTNEVLQSQVPVLVDFFTDHCIPSRTVTPVIEEIESESRATLKVVKIDAVADRQHLHAAGEGPCISPQLPLMTF